METPETASAWILDTGYWRRLKRPRGSWLSGPSVPTAQQREESDQNSVTMLVIVTHADQTCKPCFTRPQLFIFTKTKARAAVSTRSTRLSDAKL